MTNEKKTGFYPAEILIPETDDKTAWAVIACDQFTGDVNYWKKLENSVKGKKTTLDLVLPEIYLNSDADERIKRINRNMTEYEKDGVFKKLPTGFILTVRSTPYVKKRVGIIGKLDLDEYEYKGKSSSLIRATEGTIEERIPPRLKIRKDATIEFPHVMVLMDDEKREIAEGLYEKRNELEKIYDFDLNMGGGHVTGYFIYDYEKVLKAFSNLLDEERLTAKYGFNDKFAFAVGDGNHSLATAKTHWEEIKKGLTEKEKETHPARFALVEVVNVYDEGIYFEPIFRYVSGVDKKDFAEKIAKVNGGNFSVYDGELKTYKYDNRLADGIREVDGFIKDYVKENGGEVDYIHGEKEVKGMVDENADSVAVLFDKLEKTELFRYVSSKGAFPRKTFSMGEGVEKRYYLEGRRIK